MFPPMLMYLRVGTTERPRFGVWLPLFLVWLILLPIVVLILFVTIVVDLALLLAGHSYHHYTLLLFRCLGVIAAIRGLMVRVDSLNEVVDVEFV
jgi:hypothetical protein